MHDTDRNGGARDGHQIKIDHSVTCRSGLCLDRCQECHAVTGDDLGKADRAGNEIGQIDAQPIGKRRVQIGEAPRRIGGKEACGGMIEMVDRLLQVQKEALLFGALYLLIPGQLLAIFGMSDPAVVALGTELLRFLSLSGVFIAVALTYTGGLQGTGDTRSPLYISIVSQVVLPVGLCFAFDRLGTLEPWEIWLAILLGHITRCLLSVIKFRQGKWAEIEVRV